MRVPHAAKTLIVQVRDHLGRSPDSKAGIGTGTPTGETDGFGRQRSVKFDKVASKYLDQVLPALDDSRIEGFGMSKTGEMTVDFVATTAADSRALFALDAAEVASADSGE